MLMSWVSLGIAQTKVYKPKPFTLTYLSVHALFQFFCRYMYNGLLDCSKQDICYS